jgi:hypothetical protein
VQGKHEELSVQLIDILGRIVYIKNVDTNAASIILPFEQTATGMYMLVVATTSGERIYEQKIIVSKP